MPYVPVHGGTVVEFAPVAHVPLTGSEKDAVVAYTGDSSATDLVNGYVLDGDPPVFYVTNGNWTRDADVFDISPTSRLHTTEGVASGAAFQIPIATDVSFGGMFFFTNQEPTPYLIGVGTTFTNLNYAMLEISGTLRYQTSAATYDTTIVVPNYCWSHYFCVSETNRTSTKVYINGRLESTFVTVAGTDHADSELYIGNIDAGNGDYTGQCSDILIANSAYSDAEVMQVAQNAFGHPLPG